MSLVEYSKTERLYYQNTFLHQTAARVISIGKDDIGHFAILDKTIFHPQGGGQPDDKGYFEVHDKKFEVIKLVAPKPNSDEPDLIKHYYKVDGEDLLVENSEINMTIDIEARRLYARLHTAGHLLSNIVNKLFPEVVGYQGHHFPGQASVMFKYKEQEQVLPSFLKDKKTEIVNAMQEAIKAEISIQNNWDQETRTVQIGNMPEYPCGGTHLENTKDVGVFSIRNFKNEKNKTTGVQSIKIGYDVL